MEGTDRAGDGNGTATAAPAWAEGAASLLFALAALAAAAILLLRGAVHFPFFDECLHAHFLWLLSTGAVPHEDFLCTYPVLGYVLSLPYFRLFPENASVLLALRLLSVTLLAAAGLLLARHGRRVAGAWGWGAAPLLLLTASPPVSRFLVEYSVDPFAAAAAVAAAILLLSPPAPRRLAGAAALCLASVAFTPKYAAPLFLALCGYAAATAGAAGVPAAAGALLGGGGAVALAVLALWRTAGVDPAQALRWGYLLAGSGRLAEGTASFPQGLLLSAAVLVRDTPLLLPLLLSGVAGWLRGGGSTWTERAGGYGLLAGSLLYLLAFFPVPAQQYQAPLVLSLAPFVPFAPRLLAGEGRRRRAALLLSGLAAAALLAALPGAWAERKGTPVFNRDASAGKIQLGPPAYENLRERQSLLERIPREETVVAVWLTSPLFRRDATFVASTDREVTAYVAGLPEGAREHGFFSAEHFARRLEEHPPAYVSLYLLGIHYPPGWDGVARDFLARKGELYVHREGSNGSEWLRRDLLEERGFERGAEAAR